MAATLIAPLQLSQAPTADPGNGTAADTVNGNVSPNTGATVFRLKNTDTNPHTVTFVTPGTVEGLAIADKPVTVPSGGTFQFVSGFDVTNFGANIKYTCDSALVFITVMEP